MNQQNPQNPQDLQKAVIGTQVLTLIQELNDSPNFFKNEGEPIQKIVKIGEMLNQIGGYDTMLLACKSMKGPKGRELEFAWNGIVTEIGPWRP